MMSRYQLKIPSNEKYIQCFERPLAIKKKIDA